MHSLPMYSQAHLETSSVPVRDTCVSVRFELSCTVLQCHWTHSLLMANGVEDLLFKNTI